MIKQITTLTALFLLGLVACSGSASKPENSYLKGKLSKHSNTWLYLERIDNSTVSIIDSAKTNEKGEFVFGGKIEKKDFYRFRVTPNNTVFLVLDPKENTVYSNANIMLQEGYSLTGSVEGDLIIEVKKIREGINRHRDSLMQVLNTTPDLEKMAKQSEMESAFNSYVQSKLQRARDLIKANPDKLATVIAAELLDPDAEFEIYAGIAENLKKNFAYSGFAQSFISRVEQMRVMAIGAVAPEINLPNPTGENIALSSLRGKVVLIDFWASWCGPCRKENPNVVAMYNRYKNQGFEIYSVSLDKDKAAWERAIAQDGLSWPSHVSDLAYWSSVVVKQYGFQGIPFTVLIDREGKIIAKGLRGEDLEKALISLL